ncbi:MAG TPA: hypothetical protein VH854_11125 [Thermoanaerobaculia bacterium]|jgi:hypothetical protein|nr:hypothetical protein [Thermoanaerobaculia bacterium]
MAQKTRGGGGRSGRRAVLAAAAIALGMAPAVSAQQTIFNVPSTEVLEKRQTYVELDLLGRPQDPSFLQPSLRTAYGLGAQLEAGLNLDGFEVPGRSEPALHPTVKWRPWHDSRFALVTGAIGQFFARGSRDGPPGVLGYAEGSWAAPTGTTITAGGYWATSGYAADDPQAGPLVAVEQKLGEHVRLVADWVGGENDLGYVTPGVTVELDPWTLQLGYSIKNGDARGDAVLFQLQTKF